MRITVLGVMGVGKSYFAEQLANHLELSYHPEPFEQSLFLPKHYDELDSGRWTFHTQVEMLSLMVEQSHRYGVLDGSYRMTQHIYSKCFLSLEEQVVMTRLFQQMKMQATKPTLTVFLRADASTIRQRIKKRNRPMEQGLSFITLIAMVRLMEGLIDQRLGRQLVLDYTDFERLPELLELVAKRVN